MSSAGLVAASIGVASAASWGAGDFLGGVATKRLPVFRVVATSQPFGTALLLVLAVATGERIPSAGVLAWCAFGGIFGAIGLLTLYRALASGHMGTAAPVSGVLSAAVPALVAVVLEGAPSPLKATGFVVAAAAVWLVSGGGRTRVHARELTLAAVSGLAFGTFIAILARATPDAVLWPVVVARAGALATVVVAAVVLREPWTPRSTLLPIVALAGACDAAGSGLVVLAAHAGRLDVAAVLSSLYPAFTVSLAWLALREHLVPRQLAGLAAALLAIALITAG